MSFVRRLLNISFDLASGSFQNTTSTSTQLIKLRTSVRVKKAGTIAPTAQIEIRGMTLSDMNRLSTLGMVINLVRRNTVTIEAGDEGGSMTTVFQGNITNAWFEGVSQPDVIFHVEATSTLGTNTTNTAPTSYQGSTDVSTVMGQLAGKAGLTLENNGVNVKISNPYFPGSIGQQIQACAKAAGCAAVVDGQTLAIIPPNGSRQGNSPTISPATGMIGYPIFTVQGPYVKTIFNPAVKFYSKVTIQSDITPACGDWTVIGLDYALDSYLPSGDWMMGLQCYNLANGPPPLLPG